VESIKNLNKNNRKLPVKTMDFAQEKSSLSTPSEEFAGDFGGFAPVLPLKIIVKSSWNSVILQILTYFYQS
jgi:hypothetical protein